jgi:hypothetical protein
MESFVQLSLSFSEEKPSALVPSVPAVKEPGLAEAIAITEKAVAAAAVAPVVSGFTVPADLKTKKAKMEWLREKLAHDTEWAYRAMLTVFARQTADEKSAGATVYMNGVGFSGVDAEILTSFAKQYLAKQQRWGATARLSEKQTALLLKKMPKYAAQVLESLAG